MFFLAIGILFGWVITLFIQVDYILFAVIYYGIFVSIPVLRGKRLFTLRNGGLGE